MNPRQRIVRFERLHQLDNQLLNRLAEIARIAAAQAELAERRWNFARDRFADELNAAQSLGPTDSAQRMVWAEHRQRQIEALENHFRIARQKLLEAQQAVQTQHIRVKGWEKLLEKLRRRREALEARREAQINDEMYLQKQSRLTRSADENLRQTK